MDLKPAYVLISVVIVGVALAQSVVPVGQGSYASFPPAHEGEDPAGMQTRTIYTVDPAAYPIPTNDWWTDLLVSQYAGNMWAYPLTISADNQGVDVAYPTEFNWDGTRQERGQSLQIRAKVDAGPIAENIVLADFESETYPDGWSTTGTAFGTGPAAGTLPNQSAVSGYFGSRLVNSFLSGDGTTGDADLEFVCNQSYVSAFPGCGGESSGRNGSAVGC